MACSLQVIDFYTSPIKNSNTTDKRESRMRIYQNAGSQRQLLFTIVFFLLVTFIVGQSAPVSASTDYVYHSNYISTLEQITVSSITTSKPSPQRINTTIRITANASGSSNLLYKFTIYNSINETILRDFAASNYCDWTPLAEQNYVIGVFVKDKNSLNEYDAWNNMEYIYR